jgi:putative nucleotidyltransferase with HDIG domain
VPPRGDALTAVTDRAMGAVAGTFPSLSQRIAAFARRVGPAGKPEPVEYSVPLVATVAACVLTAVCLAIWLCRAPSDWVTLALLVIVILGVSLTAVRLSSGTEHVWSASLILHLGMTFALGPVGALAAAVAEAAGPMLRLRNGWFRVTFNLADLFVADIASWKTYQLVTGSELGPPAVRDIVAGILAGFVNWVLNHGLILAVFVAMEGRSSDPLRFIRSAMRFLPYSAAYGFAAVAFPLLLDARGTVGVAMVVAPIVAAQAFLVLLERQMTAREAEGTAHIADIEAGAQRIEVAHHVTLIALTNALDARDRETQGHSRRVVEYSREIGSVLGLDESDMRILAHGALLHDIGKIGIPDGILHKPGSLSEDEWTVMRTHPEIGAQMIEDVGTLREARRIILHHHERWDGRGYPHGLHTTQVVRGARIFSVADAIDAMTQDRPYRAAVSWDEAIDEVRRCSGSQFDPEVVEALLALPEARLLEIAGVRRPPRLDLFTSLAVADH